MSVDFQERKAQAAPGSVLAWRNGVFVIFALSGLTFASYLGRLPQVRDDLGATTLQVSLLTFGLAVGSVVGLLGSGALAARFGARRVMAVTVPALGVTMIAAAAGAQSGVYLLTLLPLVLVGLSHGVTDVCMNLSGAENERALGRTVMPAFHAAFSLGTVAGALTAAAAQAAHVPLLAHLLVVNAVLLIAGWFALRQVPYEAHDAADHAPVSRRERLAVWREPRTLVIGLMVLGMALTEGSANDWLALAMVDDHGTSKTVGTLTFAVFVTFMTIGRFAGTKVLDRFGRVPTLRACGVLAFAGLSLVIFGPTWAAYVGVALWGLGASLGFPVGMSAAADDPRMAAARVSVVSTIGYLSFLAGPPIIGALGSRITLLSALIVVLGAVAVAIVVAPAAREPARASR
ncbi:Major facilitator superfamily MFS_1 OS=Tsukamurella paurometabola (strain ATCC 8368 / DSM /CCUG 35730 / CIP 100753 / JCM 10117 / KCTC 9821 / NBRC 16120/ NCIMB 702349 / NCTC 13040) OX=521096 GN=Tpau_3060 PE=4 SV=1 [Tsukamurella paurometabola]|uniref:Major facilitator superfamily MFS_1 n=1 Tax=Tsukamurella paurometabola (strain ATCC 8368 / DSM 20162 / CCUG 35730 / CIP 100753 / JCM 10117 / KCTC 9821 / NBRC 16120 / NCIMB 702349 / NCTC 13040) TaxID=521096 RepID=D5UUT5_TSUPD|nr:MFS transporter [Tsukamurella paurometabola]ADG79653.1 major facilitator superfamily MFS_1 [Tsukamurella paurometabola DSM 20162]SUP36615.1 Inner membrane protein ybjJ [Tsukamurella paurometabola]